MSLVFSYGNPLAVDRGSCLHRSGICSAVTPVDRVSSCWQILYRGGAPVTGTSGRAPRAADLARFATLLGGKIYFLSAEKPDSFASTQAETIGCCGSSRLKPRQPVPPDRRCHGSTPPRPPLPRPPFRRLRPRVRHPPRQPLHRQPQFQLRRRWAAWGHCFRKATLLLPLRCPPSAQARRPPRVLHPRRPSWFLHRLPDGRRGPVARAIRSATPTRCTAEPCSVPACPDCTLRCRIAAPRRLGVVRAVHHRGRVDHGVEQRTQRFVVFREGVAGCQRATGISALVALTCARASFGGTTTSHASSVVTLRQHSHQPGFRLLRRLPVRGRGRVASRHPSGSSTVGQNSLAITPRPTTAAVARASSTTGLTILCTGLGFTDTGASNRRSRAVADGDTNLSTRSGPVSSSSGSGSWELISPRVVGARVRSCEQISHRPPRTGAQPRMSPDVGTPVPAVTNTCSTSGTWFTEVPRS